MNFFCSKKTAASLSISAAVRCPLKVGGAVGEEAVG